MKWVMAAIACVVITNSQMPLFESFFVCSVLISGAIE